MAWCVMPPGTQATAHEPLAPVQVDAWLRATLRHRYPHADITTTPVSGGPRALALARDGTLMAIGTPAGPSIILAVLDALTIDD